MTMVDIRLSANDSVNANMISAVGVLIMCESNIVNPVKERDSTVADAIVPIRNKIGSVELVSNE